MPQESVSIVRCTGADVPLKKSSHACSLLAGTLGANRCASDTKHLGLHLWARSRKKDNDLCTYSTEEEGPQRLSLSRSAPPKGLRIPTTTSAKTKLPTYTTSIVFSFPTKKDSRKSQHRGGRGFKERPNRFWCRLHSKAFYGKVIHCCYTGTIVAYCRTNSGKNGHLHLPHRQAGPQIRIRPPARTLEVPHQSNVSCFATVTYDVPNVPHHARTNKSRGA